MTVVNTIWHPCSCRHLNSVASSSYRGLCWCEGSTAVLTVDTLWSTREGVPDYTTFLNHVYGLTVQP